MSLMIKGIIFLVMLSACLLDATFVNGLIISPKIGYNLSQHYGTKDQTENYTVETGLRQGLIAGVEFKMPILDRINLQYDLCYANRGSTEKITIRQLDGEVLPKPAVMNVKYYMDYIDFPVVLNYNLFMNDKISMVLSSGASMSLKVNGVYKLDGVIYFPDSEGYSEIPIKDSSRLTDVNLFDFSMIYGGELKFKLSKNIPISLGYRFTIGWDYLELPTYEDGNFPPVKLRNQSYSITLGIPLSLTD